MKVCVPKEIAPGERRVALVPEVVGKLAEAGFEVLVETGAGLEANLPDADYEEKGATIVAGVPELFGQAEALRRSDRLKPRHPSPQDEHP